VGDLLIAGDDEVSDIAYKTGSGGGAVISPELELAQLIVAALNLDTPADAIDPDAPLYGEGLGLDSIDILEISLAISKNYGVTLRSDDKNDRKIFSSLRSLSQHISKHRAR
jgi:acyl carrier protein